VKKNFGKKLEVIQERIHKHPENFWANDNNILNLINVVNDRVAREKKNFGINHLNMFINLNIVKYLKDKMI